jgi:vancomycin permeability regulator SanA
MKTAIILGAAVCPTGPSPTLLRRKLHGATLYHTGQVSKLVVCGGIGKHPPSEARVMADILIGAGIPEAVIVLEALSTSTGENIANAKALIAQEPVVIVTDWYHGPRALLIARRAGLRATTSAPPLKGARLWPQLKGALREIPAYFAYLLRLKT